MVCLLNFVLQKQGRSLRQESKCTRTFLLCRQKMSNRTIRKCRARRRKPRSRPRARVVGKEAIEYWIEFSPKLRRARSRLYRRLFLHVNTRWKALAEIYTMHSFAPFWNRIPAVLQSQNFSQKPSSFFRDWILNFRFFQFIRRILQFFCEIWWIFSQKIFS